jgi:hypothetical protein
MSLGVAARPKLGEFAAACSRVLLISVAEAASSILSSSGCALEPKLHAVPDRCSASIMSAREPATKGAAIEVPCRLA